MCSYVVAVRRRHPLGPRSLDSEKLREYEGGSKGCNYSKQELIFIAAEKNAAALHEVSCSRIEPLTF